MTVKTYFTIDNGDKAYQVDVDGLHITVYDMKYNASTNQVVRGRKRLQRHVRRIFVGQSRDKTTMTDFSGGQSPRWDGNSMLFELSENPHKYLFVGSELFTFKTKHRIIKFKSPVGNSAMPYPWAQDTANCLYLFVFNVILDSKYKSAATPPSDPSSFYHESGLSLITTDYGVIPPTQPMINAFDGITKWCIGKEMYTLHYEAYPEKDYDRLKKLFPKSTMCIHRGSNKEIVHKQNYANIMKKYAKKAGLQPIRKKCMKRTIST